MRIDAETETPIEKGTHKRPSFFVVVPTFGMVSIEYHVAAQRLQPPVNAGVQALVIKGEEVGVARNNACKRYLEMGDDRPEYLFFFGDDMIPEWWHLIALYEEMRKGQWDVLSALYYMKNDEVHTPIMWRENTAGHLREGEHYQAGEVVWSDIAGMDFTLIKSDILLRMEPPYFSTAFVNGDQRDDKHISVHTEDAYFCRKVRELGGKIGIHTGVRVAHLNVMTGELY